ncbi:MAG: hypothetical protein K6T91_06370 [Firmicutes bacterium]|nr:hypothetical protein [Bacillota bacterium]
MKKALILMTAILLVFAMTSIAIAAQENPPADGKGNIRANDYSLSGKDWAQRSQGATVTIDGVDQVYAGATSSVHPYGTWNSPYTLGVDGYNYNDAQDYTDNGTLVNKDGTPGDITNASQAVFTSGPHGGYLTSTHRCRECHAVHRAAGKFKLTRGDSRYEACDWCHGTGAGSGFNIQMDNDDNYTTEYNVGHTMGFGIDNGKWKAPDDTYPAYTPNYWIGGFSCFDCHSPHANPQRIMGFDQNGNPIASIVDTENGAVYNIGNPGHDMFTSGGKGFAGDDPSKLARGAYLVPALGISLPKAKPYYLAGSWLLIKDPDREMSQNTNVTVQSPITTYDPLGLTAPMGTIDIGGGYRRDPDITITAGQEIPDAVTDKLYEFDTDTAYPINKVPTDWNNPVGSASLWDEQFGPGMPPANQNYGYTVRNPFCRSLILDEFCTDCHDGNSGFHTIQAPQYSEDRALRNQGNAGDNWKGNYDIAYGHDSNVRH